MLRYYTYYSVAGYKRFYLGSNSDDTSSTYYFSLLPVWENDQRENLADEDTISKIGRARKLPQMGSIDESEDDNFGLPDSARVLTSHGGYKFIFRHLEGDILIMSLREINTEERDNVGRGIPFTFMIMCDSRDDWAIMNSIAAYLVSHIEESQQQLSSLFAIDYGYPALTFCLEEMNEWIRQISKVLPMIKVDEKRKQVSSKDNTVSILYSTMSQKNRAIEEQKLGGMSMLIYIEPDSNISPFKNDGDTNVSGNTPVEESANSEDTDISDNTSEELVSNPGYQDKPNNQLEFYCKYTFWKTLACCLLGAFICNGLFDLIFDKQHLGWHFLGSVAGASIAYGVKVFISRYKAKQL